MAQETMYSGLVNSPETTITNNVGVSDTLIYVLDPARVPSDLPNLMTIGTGTNAETVLVESINDSAITVQRGFQGIAKEWPAGTIIARNITEYDHSAFKSNIEDLDTRVGPLANLLTTIKTSIVNAINSLKGEFDAHSADKAPHAETVNRTITVGVGKDFETIQGAIDSLKKRVDSTIGIDVDAGTYDEDVKIEGFVGKGSITIMGANQLIDAGNYKIKSLTVSQCSAYVYIEGFESTTTTADSFLINNSIGVIMYYCLATASSTFAGVKVGFSTVLISSSQVSNHARALYVYRASTVSSNTWTAGSGNTVGIECYDGSTVGKYLGQPQGTTAEVTASGGVIR